MTEKGHLLGGGSGGSCICIPIHGSDEVVRVPLEELPEDPEELLEVLQAEEASLTLWLDFAKAYLARGRLKQCRTILEHGTSQEVHDHFSLYRETGLPRPVAEQAVYQRIEMCCALAMFYTSQAADDPGGPERAVLLNKAGGQLFKARQLDQHEQLVFLGYGQLEVVRGELKAAKRNLDKAAGLLNNGRRNVAGLLAQAAVAFELGDHAGALASYRNALKEFPGCPPEVRLGIGACQFQLGDFARARLAFRRVLQLSPGNTAALVGLAVLSMNEQTLTPAHITEALQLLCQAYDADPSSPVVLNMLAHHSLLRGDADNVVQLAEAALKATESDAIRCESLTLLARARHARGELNAALRGYRQAHALDKKQPLPQLGLAQMSILEANQHTNAISMLETALDQNPGWNDAITLLGRLYPQVPAKRHTAVQQFQEAARNNTGSASVWQMLGELLASANVHESLKAYEKAVELQRRKVRQAAARGGVSVAGVAEVIQTRVPAKLLNNAAVLYMRVGRPHKALELLEEALEGRDELEAAQQVTLGFNRARVREAAGQLTAAAAEYKAMLSQLPEYTQCYLRLACIAQQCGHDQEAVDWIQQALQRSPDSPDALCLLGTMHLMRKDWAMAAKAYNAVVALQDMKHDPYARVGLATIQLYSMPHQQMEENAQKIAKHLFYALETYQIVLQKDSGNVWAANGVGAVLAEKGRLGEAAEVLFAVQDNIAAADGLLPAPDVTLNVANVRLAQQDYYSAIQLYQACLRRHHQNKDATVLLYLARAYYDSNNLPEAKRTLLQAIHVAPMDHRLRFNLALVMQEYAQRILSGAVKPTGARLEALEVSKEELVLAHRVFTKLRGLPAARTRMPPKTLDSHITFVSDLLSKAEVHVEKARRDLELLETKRHAAELRMRESQAKEAAEAARQAAAEQVERDRQQGIAAESRAKLARLKEAWKEKAVVDKAVERGDVSKIKKKKDVVADDDLAALFGGDESSDAEDYDPSAAPQGSGSDAGGDSGDDTDPGEDYAAMEADMADGDAEEATKKTPKQGRLKRGARPEPDAGTAAPAGMEDDKDQDGAAASPSERPQKRARQANVDDDDDEEQQAGAGADGDADGDAPDADDLVGDEEDADGGGGEQPAAQPAEQPAEQPGDDAFDEDGRLDDADATLEDLFGSDDEE